MITFLLTGKTDQNYWQQAMDEYTKRLSRYHPFRIIEIPPPKNAGNMDEFQRKKAEGEKILAYLSAGSCLVLLDEKGKEFSSAGFAGELNKLMNAGWKDRVFAIGGPYGFSEEVYAAAQQKISLSKMTYSHQLVRVVFMEQLYRAFTILNGEPYHHE